MPMRRSAVSVTRAHLNQAILVALIALFALTIGAFSAQANDDLDQGLKVGTAIPQDMAAPDQQGDTRSLKSLMGRSGLILLFTRSLDW